MDEVTISSALFQAYGWLKVAHPHESMEAIIADICFRAHEAIDELQAEVDRLLAAKAQVLPTDSVDPDQAVM